MAFAPSKGKKHLKKGKESLSLTSMMDMMTIILLFLLKTFSTSGAFLKASPFVDLPTAERTMEPKKTLAILVNPDLGVIQGETEISMDNIKPTDIISPVNELSDTSEVLLPGLANYLDTQRDLALRLQTGFNGQITIQCDSKVTYDWLIKVINTCGQSEYATLEFVVIKKS